MKRLILGIDDAGRGPLIGPMVLAGCLINDKTEAEFQKIGVRDSKQLTPKRRDFFEEKIKEKAEDYETVLKYPEEIDRKNAEGIKLNELEAIASAKIINKLNKGDKKIKVIIDCPSTSISKWTDFLKTQIKDLSNLEICCEHKADRNHVAVSAASILAKNKREREVSKLRKKYGEGVGSGYPSDPKTKKFLAKNAKKHHDKGIFRKTWSTWKRHHSKSKQKKLEF
jgi:ribonuclease HII